MILFLFNFFIEPINNIVKTLLEIKSTFFFIGYVYFET